MQIHTFASQHEARIATQKHLYTLLSDISQPVLFLASGGSALEVLDTEFPTPRADLFTLSVLDERRSTDPTTSNFLRFQKTAFFTSLMAQGASTLPTIPRKNESLPSWSNRIEQSIQNWQARNPSGKIIATFGMGADGHTAGIFPNENTAVFTQSFLKTTHLFQAYTAPSAPSCSERLTATYPFIKNIHHMFALVCGQSKAAALRRAVDPEEPLHFTPAGIFRELPSLTLFTDIPLKP